MYRLVSLLCAILTVSATAAGAEERLRLYIDADYSVSAQGAQAIELGVRTALAERGNRVGGFDIEVVPLDHRLNTKRSAHHFDRFAADPDGLAVIGGTYSPPYLALREEINARGLLTLLPWSAAGPITRAAEGQENFLFRLSVDDWKAGPFMVTHAADRLSCARIGLVTTDTGWGRSNRGTITATLTERGLQPHLDLVFEDDLGAAHAGEIAADIAASDADCVILVAGMIAGSRLMTNLAREDAPPRVISHWGILAGPFRERVSTAERTALGLHVLQTCGLQAEVARPARFDAVLSRVTQDAGAVSRINDIPAATGFVHGYDLTLVLIAGLEQAMAESDFSTLAAAERQRAVKAALEALAAPVDGLLRVYRAPFSDPRVAGPDGHEALGEGDLCMAQFDGDSLQPAWP